MCGEGASAGASGRRTGRRGEGHGRDAGPGSAVWGKPTMFVEIFRDFGFYFGGTFVWLPLNMRARPFRLVVYIYRRHGVCLVFVHIRRAPRVFPKAGLQCCVVWPLPSSSVAALVRFFRSASLKSPVYTNISLLSCPDKRIDVASLFACAGGQAF